MLIITQGIYLIRNNVNNKVYIGQSKDIEKRWSDHLSLGKTSSKSKSANNNYPLYRAMKKYGVENFSITILEETDDYSQLDSIENKYIEEYGAITDGYNQRITSSSGYSKEYTINKREVKYSVTKEKLRNELLSYTFEKVASMYGVSSNTIRKWCKDYGLPSSSKDYITSEKSKEFSDRMKTIARESSTKRKRIAMLDINTGEVIKVFDSVTDAGIYVNGKPHNISSAIHGTNGRKTSKGYGWKLV